MTDARRIDGRAPRVLFRLLMAAAGLLCTAQASAAQVSLNVGPGAELKADAVTTSISGNLEVEGRFDPGSGTLVLDGRGTQRIVSNRPETVHILRIDKPSGDVILLNDLTVNRSLVVERGYLDLDGYTLLLAPRAVVHAAERVRGTLGRISVQHPINNVDTLDVGGIGYIVSTRANLGHVSVTRGHMAQRIDGMPGINRYYEVAADRVPNRDVELRFRYGPGELNGIPPHDLVIYRSDDDGESWTPLETSLDERNNLLTVKTRQVTGLWTAGSRVLGAPVFIRDLTALVRRREAVLTWTSVSHTEISGFEIQLLEGEEYEAIDYLDVLTASSGEHSYSHTLGGLRPGRHVLRIVPVTAGGPLDVTREVEVHIDPVGDYTLTEPYPNPFNHQTAVQLVVSETQHVQVEVFDIQGRRVASLHEGRLAAQEEHEFVFQGDGLPSSVYLFRVTGETFSATRRVLLVR